MKMKKEKIMGFLDDFDVDPNEFISEFADAPAGRYDFVVNSGKLYISDKDGSASIQINLSLENSDGETYTKTWWLRIPADPSRPTTAEKRSMADWKNWCLGAGFTPEEIRGVGPEDVEGISGTVNLVESKPNKEGRVFVNFRDWTFDGTATEDIPPAPRAKAAPAAKPAKAAPAEAPAKGKPNPFQK